MQRRAAWVVFVAIGCAQERETPPDPDPHPRAEVVEAEVERAVGEGFSGSVAVVLEGQTVWRGGVGLADRERGTANEADTAFDCGSIMKIPTAIAVLQLEEDGVLSRHTTLGALLPDVPPDKVAITIEQVLQHRAGFDEFHDTEGDFEPMDRQTAVARILAQELLFEPGSDEAYSNSGYTLLAAIVEDAAGVPFTEHLRARIYDPAGMHDTGVYAEDLWSADRVAIGYDDGTFGCNSPACWPAPSWALIGNGGLVSTVDDLVRLADAIEDAVVLGPAMRDAFRRDILGDSGFAIDGAPIVGYSGLNDFGFGATVGEVRDRELVVAVASNAALVYDTTALAIALAEATLGAAVEPSG